ncbi:glycogen debranching N-terminal domain-containing protein [Rugosimonospora africana]|uniref:Amylo-alpha-1,6-glucosidase n=1 Tax=Rugosimonospora africana TaxID=556532 RepID=A0A8J3VRL2_9ACTN|nr:glycogen debranching N-terminal domain-containing protein [Rugosimonospora africana]GIH16330.1 amylo-alpha-1,6-glucosidase [Rugosimonospora africana]
MGDATDEFFAGLARRQHEPLLTMADGSVRFDIRDNGRTEYWIVRLSNGGITVGRGAADADCIVMADRAVFDTLASGRSNALAAVFRGTVVIEGNPLLLALFQRLFPAPQGVSPPTPRDRQLSLSADEAPISRDGNIKILDGATFVVCDTRGDIHASPADATGLFSYDTRYLSTWMLTINGQRLSPLSIDDLHYFESRFFLVPGAGSLYVDVKLTVIRQRTVCDGFCEELVILNHAEEPADLTVRIDAASDFAHLFEVKNAMGKVGRSYGSVQDGRLVLRYERESFERETTITAPADALLDEQGITVKVRVEPHGRWSTKFNVVPSTPVTGRIAGIVRRDPVGLEHDLVQWLERAPQLQSDWPPLSDTYQRSLVDLAALRFSPLVAASRTLPAAGLPWFMTMFGRDSILTSLQALPFQPELAATTLKTMAIWQGSRVDDFRDEDPGRILHELRYGELIAFEEQPHSPYFGTADATPLFVILLDEYERWTGDATLVRTLEKEARAALNWIGEYADLMGNGYISYQTRNQHSGLQNQCWKDSWDSICYRDGRLPGFPRATCELQGYAYDAKMRAARLAREFWDDPGLAKRLEEEAANLKQHFNRDFWIGDRGYYALAMDHDGSLVDALSSNIGHLLWSGIVDKDKADDVVGHLLGPQLFSGWGIRTLGSQEQRYNPIGYHVGTVWPFDNSFIAWGLRRYGYADEAARVASGILDAANFFSGRLPEAFGGYERSETRYPVEYPTACSPQAWSTGAPLLLLRTMLGLEPYPDHLAVSPALPSGIGRIELLDIPWRGGRFDAFGRGRVQVNVVQGQRPQLGLGPKPSRT